MLRTMSKADLPQLLAIEKSVHVTPWTDETFLTCFDSGCAGWVMVVEVDIVGFVLISVRAGECHVLNLCVDLPHQRQGFGRQLLEHALKDAKTNGAGIAYLEVRRSNVHAIHLYRKQQFRLVGERKGYYPDAKGQEDALIFARSL